MAFRAGSFLRTRQTIGRRHIQLQTRGSKLPPLTHNTFGDGEVRTSPKIKISTNGNDYMLDSVFLRDSCPCVRCVDPSTKQKLFDTASIPFTVKAREPEVQSDGSVKITWENDIPEFGSHTSVYRQEFFSASETYRSCAIATHDIFPSTLWDRRTIEENSDPTDYASYMSSSATLHKALSHLQRYGLLFLSSVPSDPNSVEMVANRIGPLRQTFYGSTWDVRSVPSAKNIAYTSSHIGFHMVSILPSSPSTQIWSGVKFD